MTLQIDSDLKNEFISYVNRAYNGKTEEGILDLIRVYVERAKGAAPQSEIKRKVKQYVFEGEAEACLSAREIEKIMLNKTDEDIEAARLDKK